MSRETQVADGMNEIARTAIRARRRPAAHQPAARCLAAAALVFLATLSPALAASIPLPPERPGTPIGPSPFEDPMRMANGFAPFERRAALVLPDLSLPRASALTLEAQLAPDMPPLGRGLHWRIFSIAGAEGAAPSDAAPGEPVLLTETRDARPALDLAPGAYIVNCRFGAASVTTRVVVGLSPMVERVVLDAGALRITTLLGPSEPAPEDRVTLDIYSRDPDLDAGSAIVKGAEAGALVRVPAGSYWVVSRYGDGNAVRRTKVRVDAGRLTDAQIVHAAAEISFKLVTAPGGEALAGTSWTVLTPGGDTVLESDGAYAGQVLAAGDYVAVAKLGTRIFNQPFTVETGADTEIEVVAAR